MPDQVEHDESMSGMTNSGSGMTGEKPEEFDECITKSRGVSSTVLPGFGVISVRMGL
jgi:hypothetical protein